MSCPTARSAPKGGPCAAPSAGTAGSRTRRARAARAGRAVRPARPGRAAAPSPPPREQSRRGPAPSIERPALRQSPPPAAPPRAPVPPSAEPPPPLPTSGAPPPSFDGAAYADAAGAERPRRSSMPPRRSAAAATRSSCGPGRRRSSRCSPLGTIAAVSYWGLPDWVPVSRPTFALGQPDLQLDFPADQQERRQLPNGTEYFGASGTITNVGSEAQSVPPILIVLRDARDRIVYSLEVQPPKRSLAPGESVTVNEAVTDVPRSARSPRSAGSRPRALLEFDQDRVAAPAELVARTHRRPAAGPSAWRTIAAGRICAVTRASASTTPRAGARPEPGRRPRPPGQERRRAHRTWFPPRSPCASALRRAFRSRTTSRAKLLRRPRLQACGRFAKGPLLPRGGRTSRALSIMRSWRNW